MTEVQAECIRRIAEAKALPVESVHLNSSLESLAVDSLDRVSLAFDLEEQYGVEIPESEMHALKTVGDVADAVQRAMAKKQDGAATGQAASGVGEA